MRFILIGKAKDVFNTLRQLALLEVLTWDKHEEQVDANWWLLRFWIIRN